MTKDLKLTELVKDEMNNVKGGYGSRMCACSIGVDSENRLLRSKTLVEDSNE